MGSGSSEYESSIEIVSMEKQAKAYIVQKK